MLRRQEEHQLAWSNGYDFSLTIDVNKTSEKVPRSIRGASTILTSSTMFLFAFVLDLCLGGLHSSIQSSNCLLLLCPSGSMVYV